MACIFLLVCVLLDPAKRKYGYIAGAVVDLLMFLYSRNKDMLFTGIVCGLILGIFPYLGNKRKYDIAQESLGGKGDLIIVFVIFFTMIFMTMAVAYPDMKVSL